MKKEYTVKFHSRWLIRGPDNEADASTEARAGETAIGYEVTENECHQLGQTMWAVDLTCKGLVTAEEEWGAKARILDEHWSQDAITTGIYVVGWQPHAEEMDV